MQHSLISPPSPSYCLPFLLPPIFCSSIPNRLPPPPPAPRLVWHGRFWGGGGQAGDSDGKLAEDARERDEEKAAEAGLGNAGLQILVQSSLAPGVSAPLALP